MLVRTQPGHRVQTCSHQTPAQRFRPAIPANHPGHQQQLLATDRQAVPAYTATTHAQYRHAVNRYQLHWPDGDSVHRLRHGSVDRAQH